jgi:hypothetical protein
MALGLESNIAETAKAFQGNPQALQQRYTQKQDLFDLLALNMIKKNQDAAKRSLMLSQQKMPGTVLEQVEGAVTKNAAEKVKGVAGALATKNAQTQKNMQKMAGVSGAPAPNMAKMAGGGIVGFAAGKEVESSGGILDDAWYMIKSLATGLKKKDLEAIQEKEGDSYLMSYAKKVAQTGNALLPANILKTIGLDKSKEELNALIKKASESPPAFGSEFLTKPRFSTGKDGSGIDEKLLEEQKRMQQGQLSGLTSLQKSDVKPEVEDKPPVVPGAGVDSFSADKSGGIAAAPAFDASKFAADGAFNQKVKGGIKDLLDSDPQKAVDFAARTPAEKAMIEKLFKERSDMRDNRLNPDKLSSDRLSQMLLGAKGATAGEAFRTAGLAGINADRNVENIKRSEFDAINKLFMDEANKSQSIKQKAFEGSQADKKQGVASGSSVTNAEKNAQMEAEKLFATIENNKVANKLKSDLNSITAKRITAQENNTLANVDTALLRDLTNVEKSASTQFLKEYEAKMNSLLTSGKKRDERDRLEKQYKKEYELNLENLRDGIAAERDTIKSRLTARTGGIDTSGFTVKKKS